MGGAARRRSSSKRRRERRASVTGLGAAELAEEGGGAGAGAGSGQGGEAEAAPAAWRPRVIVLDFPARAVGRMGRGSRKIRGLEGSAQAASELAALDDYARLHGAWDELPMLVGGTVGVAGPGPGPARRQVAKAGAFVRRIPRNVRHLLAGALSGACGKTATAPIEAVRMRVMVGQGTARACVAKVWAAGGPLAFFQGNLADVVRVAPQKAIQLAAFDAFKKTFAKPDETGKPVTAPHLCFLSGGLAGIASTVACYPLETLRTRLGCDSTYNGLVDCTVRMWREEGPLSLYKGLSASVVGVIPYAALNLGLYDSMKKVYLRLTREERVPNQIAGAFGALAGPLAATGTFPLEVVRRRAMMGEVYANVPAAVLTIYRREGLPALFKGCGLTWIKHAPSAFITFTLYETFKEQLLLK